MQAPMEVHWLILGRVLRVVPPEEAVAQAQHATVVGEAEDAAQVELAAAGDDAEVAAQMEVEHATAGDAEVAAQPAEVEAAQAAAAEPEPDFTISVAAPPRVTFLAAGHNSHPVPAKPDQYPYIIASGSFCLLARFSTGQYHGTSFSDRPRVSHLVVVRHFRRHGANGQIAATAERVPRRTRDIPDLSNVESVGFLCNHDERTYTIAELRVVTGRFHSASLVCYRSSSGRWSTTKLNTPSALRGDRAWEPHGAVAFFHSTVVWFDLSWGILICDCDDLDRHDALRFYDLPLGRALDRLDYKSKDNIHARRCITVSGDMVRYVEVIAPTTNDGEGATVCMWCLVIVGDGADGWQWCPNYRVSFDDIRNHPSYIAAELPQPQSAAAAVPDLVCVSPVNPSVVYFALDQRIFGVDVPNHLVLHCEKYQLVEVPRQPRQQASGRFIVTWNLHPPGVGGNVGYVSQEPYVTFPEDVSDDEDEAVPEPKTTAWARRGSKSVRIVPMGVSRRRRQ